MKRTRAWTIALLIVFTVTSVVWAWKREFGQKFSSKNSWDKKAAISGLDQGAKNERLVPSRSRLANDFPS